MSLTLLSLNIIFLFIAIAAFSGAISQIYGPIGILTRRRQARVDIVSALNKAGGLLPKVKADGVLCVFGIKALTKKGISSASPVPVTNALLNSVSEEGALGKGSYKYLGVALKRQDGAYDISYRDLAKFSWIFAARNKGVALPQLTEQLNAVST